jgi:hypothetical protein
MKYRGRPVLAAILGLFTGLFVALDLVFFGAVRLDNIVVTILPIVGLIAGIVLALWAPLGRKRAAIVASSALTVLVLLVAGCGSPSPKAAAGASTTASTQSVSSKTADSASSGQPLPAPCTLLTKQDVSALFGTTALNATSSQGPQPGTAACSFSLSVGSQGLGVSVRTHDNYANDPSYVFPQTGKKIAGLGDLALISSAQAHSSYVTVKLGKNALVVYVDFYDKPVDDAFLTQLAKDAVARL